jgi:hypothetical protein
MGAIPSGSPAPFVRGDGDGNGAIEITDALIALGYLFQGQVGPACLDRLDSNDDGAIDISDPLHLLFYLFGAGPPPTAPFPGPGLDPTSDSLACR